MRLAFVFTGDPTGWNIFTYQQDLRFFIQASSLIVSPENEFCSA